MILFPFTSTMTPVLSVLFLLACVVMSRAHVPKPFPPRFNTYGAFGTNGFDDQGFRHGYNPHGQNNYGHSNYGYQKGFSNVGTNGGADNGYRRRFNNYHQNSYGQNYGYQNSFGNVGANGLAENGYNAFEHNNYGHINYGYQNGLADNGYRSRYNAYEHSNYGHSNYGYQNGFGNFATNGLADNGYRGRYNGYEHNNYGHNNYGYNGNFGSFRLIGPIPTRIGAEGLGIIGRGVPRNLFGGRLIVGDGPFPGYKLVGRVRVSGNSDKNKKTKRPRSLRKLVLLRLLQQIFNKISLSKPGFKRPTATELYHGH